MNEPTLVPADDRVAGRDYPADLVQLRAWFPSDAACLDYLDWLRWPEGFHCPHCGSDDAGQDPVGRYRCRGCWKQVSVTSGTIFEKTRTPLTVWFEAAWLMTAGKTGISAAHLHRVLPISSYQTAWTMLAKFRSVMTTTASEPLSGLVEIDETFIVGPSPVPLVEVLWGNPWWPGRSRSRARDGAGPDSRSSQTRLPRLCGVLCARMFARVPRSPPMDGRRIRRRCPAMCTSQ